VKLVRGQQAVAGGVRVGEALVPQEQGSIPGVGDHSQPHAGHVILQGGVDGVERPQRDVHISGEEQGAGGRQGVDGATRGDSDGDPAGHTHHPQVLAAVDVDAGLNRTQNHRAVSAFVHTD